MSQVLETDFAYAITVHKSQGSQYGSCIVFDESSVFGDSAQQWLYTAVTRSREVLTILTENLE
jgi:exodeoxyribonuclease-5